MTNRQHQERADGDQLSRAQAIIEQQQSEIAHLREQLESEKYARELRENLSLAAVAGTIASPVSHAQLLEMIVGAAAHVIGAQAASLFLVDKDAQELQFEVALGRKAEEVKHFRVPLGHGIAGLVAITGQPMAVSDASQDPRHAHEISQAIGYLPQSILCAPLFYCDEVIGVIELLDKRDAHSFSPADMETLSLFANQAAVAIEQSRTHRNLIALVSEALASLNGIPDYRVQALQDVGRRFAASIEEDEAYQKALELASLVKEISSRGENELNACRTILLAFVEYLRLRPAATEELCSIGGIR